MPNPLDDVYAGLITISVSPEQNPYLVEHSYAYDVDVLAPQGFDLLRAHKLTLDIDDRLFVKGSVILFGGSPQIATFRVRKTVLRALGAGAHWFGASATTGDGQRIVLATGVMLVHSTERHGLASFSSEVRELRPLEMTPIEQDAFRLAWAAAHQDQFAEIQMELTHWNEASWQQLLRDYAPPEEPVSTDDLRAQLASPHDGSAQADGSPISLRTHFTSEGTFTEN